MSSSILPVLTPSDIQQAANLIQQLYIHSPTHPLSPDDQRRLNNELFELQKRWEAWGLVVPFLMESEDGNVQFFGAHTAQVKIARDWDSFPKDRTLELKELLLDLTGKCIVSGRSKVILRKLFVAITSLALKLVPSSPTSSSTASSASAWPDWILSSVTALSGRGAPPEHILDFLEIVAQEMSGAEMLVGHKAKIQQSLQDAVPLVTQAIGSTLQLAISDLQSRSQARGFEQDMEMGTGTRNLGVERQSQAAMRCFEAWVVILPASDLTPLLPPLFTLLHPPSPPHFIPSTEALLSVLSSSIFTDGAAPRTLTEPLLVWMERWGPGIVERMQRMLASGSEGQREGEAESGMEEDEEEVGEVASALCRLLVGLGDQSTEYLAENIVEGRVVEPTFDPLASSLSPSLSLPTSTPNLPSTSSSKSPPPTTPQKSKATLVQTFLHLLLSFTATPGYYGIDEEESESTLGFWYLFQEALWSVEVPVPSSEEELLKREFGKSSGGFGSGYGYQREGGEGRGGGTEEEEREREMLAVSRAVYARLVGVLREKVRWPRGGCWVGERYRRDVGDTLINAFYILRKDMVAYYVNDIVERLSTPPGIGMWEEIEASLHCLMSIEEAVPKDEREPSLERLFGPEVLGRLPTSGHTRLRRTTLGLIGSYAQWFTVLPPSSPLLMTVISYVVSALSSPPPPPSSPTASTSASIPISSRTTTTNPTTTTNRTTALSLLSHQAYNPLSLQAANALRDLCDANRTALAPHIAAFGELHAQLAGGVGSGLPETERAKVLQSIASVVQALPPEEGVGSVEAIVSPVVAKLFEALRSSSQLPEESRLLAISQLQALTGVSKGLTRTTDIIALEDDSAVAAESHRMQSARDDPRMVKVREGMVEAIRAVVDLWCEDAAMSDAISDLFKSITALPSDATLISLPPAPLLELVCRAAQRHLTAVWLSLANMLIVQLDAPPPFSISSRAQALKVQPSAEVLGMVRDVVRLLVEVTVGVFGLGQIGGMEDNPDIVQAFFGCMEKAAHHFVAAFYQLPREVFDALVRCAITSLALQERYSLVAASGFLTTLINRTHASDTLGDARSILVQTHGPSIMRAILAGFAGVAPRSATQNLIELLGTLVTKYPAESRAWMGEVLFASDFVQSRAGPDAKEKFVKAVFSSRSVKRTREAAQQFSLVARGLEGSSFGYATVTM